MSNDILKNQYLTVANVGRYLNISQSKAYELAHRKDFPVCRFGGSIRIPREAFLSWVEQHTCIPNSLGAGVGVPTRMIFLASRRTTR